MDSTESLFHAIENLLHASWVCQQEAITCAAFWQTRSVISSREMKVLVTLLDGPRSMSALAAELEMDCTSCARFLRGLVGIGVLDERHGEYTLTGSARLYCQSVRGGHTPRAE